MRALKLFIGFSINRQETSAIPTEIQLNTAK
jgi:hypothetical protein